jgi:two-component system nitrogen regulation response regulator NtrX
MVEKDNIALDDIPVFYTTGEVACDPTGAAAWFGMDGLKAARDAFEKDFIRYKLAQHGNNITRTAETIGVNRSYLQKKLKRAR